jgi:hypothetical protein
MKLHDVVIAGPETVRLAGRMRATTTPEVVTQVADRLGFWYGMADAADFPTEELDALLSEERTEIVLFRDEARATGRRLAILAHPAYFSLRRTVEKQAEVYWPVDSPMSAGTQLVMAILMDHEVRLQGMESRLGAVEGQVVRLAEQIGEMKRRQAEEAAHRKFEAQSLRRDPMLLALEGGGLLTAQRVILGPCWGPEFDPAFLQALGFRV